MSPPVCASFQEPWICKVCGPGEIEWNEFIMLSVVLARSDSQLMINYLKVVMKQDVQKLADEVSPFSYLHHWLTLLDSSH